MRRFKVTAENKLAALTPGFIQMVEEGFLEGQFVFQAVVFIHRRKQHRADTDVRKIGRINRPCISLREGQAGHNGLGHFFGQNRHTGITLGGIKK